MAIWLMQRSWMSWFILTPRDLLFSLHWFVPINSDFYWPPRRSLFSFSIKETVSLKCDFICRSGWVSIPLPQNSFICSVSSQYTAGYQTCESLGNLSHWLVSWSFGKYQVNKQRETRCLLSGRLPFPWGLRFKLVIESWIAPVNPISSQKSVFWRQSTLYRSRNLFFKPVNRISRQSSMAVSLFCVLLTLQKHAFRTKISSATRIQVR